MTIFTGILLVVAVAIGLMLAGFARKGGRTLDEKLDYIVEMLETYSTDGTIDMTKMEEEEEEEEITAAQIPSA